MKMATLEKASKVANKLIPNLLGKNPNFGFPTIKIKELKRGKETFTPVDCNSRALLAAINLILANEGSQDNWLQSSLTTAMAGICSVSLEQATKINRFLIEEGVINRRSSKVQRLVNGRLTITKLWEISNELKNQIEQIPDEEKIKIRETGSTRNTKFVKGNSQESERVQSVLHKLDSVELKFHPQTAEFCELAHEELEDLPLKERNAKRLEIEALEDAFEEYGDKPFHLTHRCDFRGRIYALGGFISTQGSKLMKACIGFADADPEPSEKHTAIFLGRERGCKGTDTEALNTGMTAYLKPKSILEKAILSNLEHAKISLDGSSNGIQWQSALMGNTKAAELVNLIGNEPQDLYTWVMDEYDLQSRDIAKKLIMPWSYGATITSLAKACGLPRTEVEEIIESLDETLGIAKFQELIQRKARREIKKGASEFIWETPDEFLVHHSYKTNTEILNIGTFYAEVGDSVVDERKLVAALAPNIVHSIDAYHARLIIEQCNFPIIPIHDSFGCHSSNIPELKRIIQSTFQQVIQEDVLNTFFEQLGFGRKWETIDPKLIVNPYMFM